MRVLGVCTACAGGSVGCVHCECVLCECARPFQRERPPIPSVPSPRLQSPVPSMQALIPRARALVPGVLAIYPGEVMVGGLRTGWSGRIHVDSISATISAGSG